MKKLILLLSFAAPLLGLAQSATILPNSLSVPKVSALSTCNTAAKGNQVLNTTDNKMYYCNGTNWQEMTGGGFTLPYSATDSLESSFASLLFLENKRGRAIYAKTLGAIALKAESENGYGVHSISRTAIAGYFEATGNEPTLYVYSLNDEAAYMKGNVTITKELIVDGNKGIVRSNSSTQMKVVRTTGSFYSDNLAVGAYVDSGDLDYSDFGGLPTVTVGQIINSTATGEWYKVQIVPINVTATHCQLRIVNLASDPITFTGTWHFLIVGPE